MKVAEAENIQISDEKLDEELAKMAEMYKWSWINSKSSLANMRKSR
ncbi:MAG: hypothetical protein ACLRNP_19020 [Blautia coccoides]